MTQIDILHDDLKFFVHLPRTWSSVYLLAPKTFTGAMETWSNSFLANDGLQLGRRYEEVRRCQGLSDMELSSHWLVVYYFFQQSRIKYIESFRVSKNVWHEDHRPCCVYTAWTFIGLYWRHRDAVRINLHRIKKTQTFVACVRGR